MILIYGSWVQLDMHVAFSVGKLGSACSRSASRVGLFFKFQVVKDSALVCV